MKFQFEIHWVVVLLILQAEFKWDDVFWIRFQLTNRSTCEQLNDILLHNLFFWLKNWIIYLIKIIWNEFCIHFIFLLNNSIIKTLKTKILNISKQFPPLMPFKMMMSNMKNFRKTKMAKKTLKILLIWFMKTEQLMKNLIILITMKRLMKNLKKNYLMLPVRILYPRHIARCWWRLFEIFNGPEFRCARWGRWRNRWRNRRRIIKWWWYLQTCSSFRFSQKAQMWFNSF